VFSIFKSKEQQQRDMVISAIRKHIIEAAAEIAHADGTLSLHHRYQAATTIFNVAIYVDRTAAAVEARSQKVKSMLEAGRAHHAFGTMLATRLVIAAVLLGQLSGKEWMDASFAVAELEGMLHGFMERAGVTPWPIPYAYDGQFEKFRKEFAAREAEEEQRAIAMYHAERRAQGSTTEPDA
jgi:hypothetical protein